MKTDTVIKPKRHSAATQQAVIAALATGMNQRLVAQQFGVHHNTVSAWKQAVRKVQNPANPLSAAYDASLTTKSKVAIERALDDKRDPYKAATIGVKWLEGKGVLTQKVETSLDQHITISWGTVSPEPINVTPAIIDPDSPDNV